MNYIQRTIVMATCLMGPLFAMASPEVNVNGEPITTLPAKITLQGDNVNVHFSDGTTSSFDMDEIVVNFSSLTDVATLQNKIFAVNSLVGDQLVLTGVEAGKRVSVVSILGNTVYTGETESGELVIDASGMASGIYLLNVDGKVVKFIKK